MCGFFGFVDFSNKITPKDHDEVKDGVKAMSYRGPDDHGFFLDDKICLGFNRLSIIDLAAPSQPYSNEDDSIIICCNGEIYNYRQLRKTLIGKNHIFKTNTDSEVIVHGYEEWGSEIWCKLKGIFSIIVWDKKKQKLYLVRDYFGVKPLHYLQVGNRVYFSSDYNSFFKQSRVKIEPNKKALLSYFSFRYVIGEQTFYKDIKDVLPGHVMHCSSNGISSECYWDIPIEEEQDRGERYYLNILGDKLSQAVEGQLMSDVPLGAFISGGLDSSLLLYYLAMERKDVNTFSMGFDDKNYDETPYALLLSKHLKTKFHKLTIKQEEFINRMDEVISFRGEPASIPHEVAFLKMSQFMKKEITVVLSGEGADELFGGYGRIFRSPHDYNKQKMFKFFSQNKFQSPMEHFLWRYSWFTEQDKRSLLNLDYFGNRYFDDYSITYINELFSKTGDTSYYKKMYYLMGKVHLVNMLNRLDRMTMAASVEARVPFLDVDLVEFVSKIPLHYKLKWNNGFSKFLALLKNSEQISERHDNPKFILKRLAQGKIPKSIIQRKKVAFPVPVNLWLGDKLKGKARELLLSSDSKTKELINVKNLERFLSRKNYADKFDYDGKKIWMLMNLEIWMRNNF